MTVNVVTQSTLDSAFTNATTGQINTIKAKLGVNNTGGVVPLTYGVTLPFGSPLQIGSISGSTFGGAASIDFAACATISPPTGGGGMTADTTGVAVMYILQNGTRIGSDSRPFRFKSGQVGVPIGLRVVSSYLPVSSTDTIIVQVGWGVNTGGDTTTVWNVVSTNATECQFSWARIA